jgi:1-acyl-sn-glycerol-3-phosphate acyltransferase
MDAILALFRFSFSGEKLESIPAEPCVIVCNHLSRFDPMVTFCLMKGRRLGFISKKENLRIPIAGPIISKIGFLPLDRENPLRAMRTIHAAAKLVSGQGYTMGIYPEGTRSYDGTLLEFKTGAFVLAKKASAPIVISVIEGTNQYKKNWPWRRTPVSFRVLDVIAAQQVQSLCAEELSDRCRETIPKAQKEREVTPSA